MQIEAWKCEEKAVKVEEGKKRDVNALWSGKGRQMLFTRKNVKKQKNGKTAKNEGNAGISRIVGRLKKGIDIFCEP